MARVRLWARLHGQRARLAAQRQWHSRLVGTPPDAGIISPAWKRIPPKLRRHLPANVQPCFGRAVGEALAGAASSSAASTPSACTDRPGLDRTFGRSLRWIAVRSRRDWKPPRTATPIHPARTSWRRTCPASYCDQGFAGQRSPGRCIAGRTGRTPADVCGLRFAGREPAESSGAACSGTDYYQIWLSTTLRAWRPARAQ